jgi:uncharacterized lipoprotein YddW (UPF0748 family)
MQRIVGSVLVAAFAAFSAGPVAASSTSRVVSTVALGPPQYRAIWVDVFHDGMKSPAQIGKLVADAQRANLNALFVQVRASGDAYFNYADEPRATDIRGPRGFDPLAYVIRLAHAATPRIEVHAWLNTFFAGESSQVYQQHGSVWGNRASDGSTSGYLDPGVPEVQIYTHQIFMDVARNYNVDGLHMDFVRYPGVEWGYSPEAVHLYMLETGTQSPPASGDERWKAWRRDRVTGFVRDLHNDLQLTYPKVKLSGAFICFGGGPVSAGDWQYTSAHSSVFQDWSDWVAKGYVDFGVPMNYDSDWNGRQQVWFNNWLNYEKDSGFASRIVTGVGAFLNYPEDTLSMINRVLAPSARGNRVLGVAIYSYGSTSVYGSDDFYGYPDLAAGLPRQPYFAGLSDQNKLAERARTFNDLFMTELAHPGSYSDVAYGRVATQPVFTQPAAIPVLAAS